MNTFKPPRPPRHAEPLDIDVEGNAWKVVIPEAEAHSPPISFAALGCGMMILLPGLLLVGGVIMSLGDMWNEGRWFSLLILGPIGFGIGLLLVLIGGLVISISRFKQYDRDEETVILMEPGLVTVQIGSRSPVVFDQREAPNVEFAVGYRGVDVMFEDGEGVCVACSRSQAERTWLCGLMRQFFLSGGRMRSKDD